MTPRELFLAGIADAQAAAAFPMPSAPEARRFVAQVDPAARRLFESGLWRMALVEIPLLPQLTTPRSPFYRHRCAECEHTVRVGEMAAECPACRRLYHWNPLQGLDCLGVVYDHEGGRCLCGEVAIPPLPPNPRIQVSANQTTLFLAGLSEQWGAFGGQQPVPIPLELQGILCAVCGHTVRRGELVVPCPCGNGPAGRCPALIHLDLPHQLHCWNEWHAGRGKKYCALTGHAYREATP